MVGGEGKFHKAQWMDGLFPSERAYSWTPVVQIAVLFLRQASQAATCYKPFIEQWILKVNWYYFKSPLGLGRQMDRMTDCYYGGVIFIPGPIVHTAL